LLAFRQIEPGGGASGFQIDQDCDESLRTSCKYGVSRGP
jgi:hypothetical protein